MLAKVPALVVKLDLASGVKNYEYKICSGQDLCLVCRSNYGSTDLAGSHLDGDPRQQLIKQDNKRWNY